MKSCTVVGRDGNNAADLEGQSFNLGRYVEGKRGQIIDHFPDASSADLQAAYIQAKETVLPYLNILRSVFFGFWDGTSSTEFIEDPRTQELIKLGLLKLSPDNDAVGTDASAQRVEIDEKNFNHTLILDLIHISCKLDPLDLSDIEDQDVTLSGLVETLFEPNDPCDESSPGDGYNGTLTYDLLNRASIPRFGRTNSDPRPLKFHGKIPATKP